MFGILWSWFVTCLLAAKYSYQKLILVYISLLYKASSSLNLANITSCNNENISKDCSASIQCTLNQLNVNFFLSAGNTTWITALPPTFLICTWACTRDSLTWTFPASLKMGMETSPRLVPFHYYIHWSSATKKMWHAGQYKCEYVLQSSFVSSDCFYFYVMRKGHTCDPPPPAAHLSCSSMTEV